jgi:hypothetical protein
MAAPLTLAVCTLNLLIDQPRKHNLFQPLPFFDFMPYPIFFSFLISSSVSE